MPNTVLYEKNIKQLSTLTGLTLILFKQNCIQQSNISSFLDNLIWRHSCSQNDTFYVYPPPPLHHFLCSSTLSSKIMWFAIFFLYDTNYTLLSFAKSSTTSRSGTSSSSLLISNSYQCFYRWLTRITRI